MNIEDPIIFNRTYMFLHPEKKNCDKKKPETLESQVSINKK